MPRIANLCNRMSAGAGPSRMDAELASQIAQIRDVLPDYGDGFLAAALQVRVSVSLIVVDDWSCVFHTRGCKSDDSQGAAACHQLSSLPASIPACNCSGVDTTNAWMPASCHMFTMPACAGRQASCGMLPVPAASQQAAGVIDALLEALLQQAESCMLQTLELHMFTLIADIYRACPQHFGGRPERVIDTLLEGSLPPELVSLDPHSAAMPRPQPPAAVSAPTASRGSAAGAVPHSRAGAPGHRCEHT